MSENLTPWQKYKQNLGETRPWHLIGPAENFVPEIVQEERFSICKSCPELLPITHQCKKCGCFMSAKTKLAKAVCPLQKWAEFTTSPE